MSKKGIYIYLGTGYLSGLKRIASKYGIKSLLSILAIKLFLWIQIRKISGEIRKFDYNTYVLKQGQLVYKRADQVRLVILIIDSQS